MKKQMSGYSTEKLTEWLKTCLYSITPVHAEKQYTEIQIIHKDEDGLQSQRIHHYLQWTNDFLPGTNDFNLPVCT